MIPDLHPLQELKKERDAAVRRAEEAEHTARKAVQAEISRVREENNRLRDEVFDLRGGSRGKCLYSAPVSSSIVDSANPALFLCEAREDRLRTDLAQLEESATLAYAEIEAEREAISQELEGTSPT